MISNIMTYHLKQTLDKSLNKVYIFTFVTNLNKLCGGTQPERSS